MAIGFIPLLMKKNVGYSASVSFGEPGLPPERPRKSVSRRLRNAWNHSHLATKLFGCVKRRLVSVLQSLTLLAMQYTLYSIGLHLALQLGEHGQQAQVPSAVFAIGPDSFVNQVDNQPASLEFSDGSQGILQRTEDSIVAIHNNHVTRLGFAEYPLATWSLRERNLEGADGLVGNRIHKHNSTLFVQDLFVGFDVSGLVLKTEPRFDLTIARNSHVSPSAFDGLDRLGFFGGMKIDNRVSARIHLRNGWGDNPNVFCFFLCGSLPVHSGPLDCVCFLNSKGKKVRVMFSQDGIDGCLELSECRTEVDVIVNEVKNDLSFFEPADHRSKVANVSKHAIDRPADKMITRSQLIEQFISRGPLPQQTIAVCTNGTINEHPFGLVIRETCRGPPNVRQSTVLVFDCIINLGFYGHRARN